MTPQVYCARLERALSLMPAAERQETIRYYLEFLEDASEEERAALGTCLLYTSPSPRDTR